METTEKIVEYDTYCRKCSHWTKNEHDSPCDECLAQPVNENSHKPVYFEEKGA